MTDPIHASQATPVKSPSTSSKFDGEEVVSPYHVTSSPYHGENAKAAQLAASASASDLTPSELKHVLRKIDLILMPI
ncbi:hypothetical protein, partial [Sporisorium scitamineum]